VASRAALADPDSASVATTGMLHRIVRVYATIGIVVPMLGVATAVNLGVLGDVWILTSIALTVVAAVILTAVVLPAQRLTMAAIEGTGSVVDVATRLTRRLGTATGIFNLLWVVVRRADDLSARIDNRRVIRGDISRVGGSDA
jgi:uncharacterized membrane protein